MKRTVKIPHDLSQGPQLAIDRPHAEQLLEKISRGQSTINEVRHDLGLAPVEGGNVRLKKRD